MKANKELQLIVHGAIPMKANKELQLIGEQMVDFNKETLVYITAFELTLFSLLGCGALYKIAVARRHGARFLLAFYAVLLADLLIYLAMLVYQIVSLARDVPIELVVLIMTNVYSIVVEASLLFLLSFYWKETETLLRSSGVEHIHSMQGVKDQLRIKGLLTALWTLAYSGYLAYSVATGQYDTSEVSQTIFYYAGQGGATALLVWGNFSQAWNAKGLSSTLNKFQSLISYSMNKSKFRCIYWLATTLNFLRLTYLITVTVLLKLYPQNPDTDWLAIMIYTFTALIPLAIYLYSFQIGAGSQKADLKSDSDSQNSYRNIERNFQSLPKDSSPIGKKASKNPRDSIHQTELSSSYDSKRDA